LILWPKKEGATNEEYQMSCMEIGERTKIPLSFASHYNQNFLACLELTVSLISPAQVKLKESLKHKEKIVEKRGF